MVPNRLVSQLVLLDTVDTPVVASSRRLLQAAAAKPAYSPKAPIEIADCVLFSKDGEICPPTLGEIERVQLFFWTLVVLILVLSMSVCCLCNMDIGRDSILYAKFITEGHQKDQ